MDFFNKAMNFGFGAFSLTKEKAEKLIEEMAEKGEVSREEAKQAIDELIRKGSEQKTQIQNLINDEISKFKNNAPYVSKAEFEDLQARVKELEAKFSAE